jgi:2-methylisocitrate lyase-like PEP mutase family enzyme
MSIGVTVSKALPMLTRTFPIELAEATNMSVKPHVSNFETIVAARARGGGGLLAAPGCWDAFSARMASDAGAMVLSLSPRTVAMARHGRMGDDLVTFGEVANIAASVREGVDLPLIVEAQGGYGNALNVIRTVKLFERAGASAIDISDAVSPGSVQEGAGDVVVRPADMIGKLKAAVDTRVDALIIARTRAAGLEGMAAAFDRLEAYLEAGADLILVEHAPDRASAQQVASHFSGRVPLIYDLGFRRDKSVTTAVLEELGYALAVCPLGLLNAMAEAAPRALADLAPPRRTRSIGVVKS